MQIKIKKDKRYKNKVTPNEIHGKYPYKLYLETMGNCVYGRYIAVISNRQLNKNGKVDSILVDVSDRVNKNKRVQSNVMPNTVSANIERYKVKEISILGIETTPMLVFTESRQEDE